VGAGFGAGGVAAAGGAAAISLAGGAGSGNGSGRTMVYGSSYDENSFQVDGVDITDNYFNEALAEPNVDAIAADFDIWPGVCGKDGQGVPVGSGSPTLRISRITVGGTGA